MPQQAPRFKPVPRIWAVFALILFALLAFNYFYSQKTPAEPVYEITYTRFKALLNESQIESIVLRGLDAQGELLTPAAIGPDSEYGQRFRTRLPDMDDETLEEKHVDIKVLPSDGQASLFTILISYLPWVLIIAFWIWIIRRAQRNISGGLGGKGELGKFLRGETKVAEIPETTFDDIAGQEWQQEVLLSPRVWARSDWRLCAGAVFWSAR